MSSVEVYVTRIRPALDDFVKQPSKTTLAKMEGEIKGFDFGQMRIFYVEVMTPLIIKLDELKGESQELRTSLLDCLRYVISTTHLTDGKLLRTILVVVLQQIRVSNGAKMHANLSEEIKLAAVLCISEALRRSSSDVWEAFYTEETLPLIGQILLSLLDLIPNEKYRKLVSASLDCLMVLFCVHDEAEASDVVLRNLVANTLFIYLPKVVIVLFKTCKADDKMGVTIKSMAIKALGRISCIMFEETSDEFLEARYDENAFRLLINSAAQGEFSEAAHNLDIFTTKGNSLQENEALVKQLQINPRSPQWIAATSQQMRPIFVETCILRAHDNVQVRKEYAELCCLLLRNCAHNLKKNFLHLLESVLALSEDEEQSTHCQATLAHLQQQANCSGIFDENAELLLDAHLNKWPRILHRCEDNEQFAELLFFKGFLHNLSCEKLQLLLLVPKNLELFVMCLLSALDLRTSRDLLNEEYSLRRLSADKSKDLVAHWRQFKYLSSQRCIDALYEIAGRLGANLALNQLIFDFCRDLIEQHSPVMNEAILLVTCMVISRDQRTARPSRLVLAELLLEQLLTDEHWQLALQPDAAWRLKVHKPSSWFKDHTPGMYSSALEVRTQDCDSDDESEPISNRVTITDAQFNVLHTCVVLDALGHCATFIGDTFDRYIFRSLHRVLLKLASSNTIVHQAATFAFVSMQRALKYAELSHFIECSTDYISFHLNSLLKKSPDSSAAVDILTVVLQHSTRGNVPHLNAIFRTICDECAKLHQTDNVNSYLRVFNAFLSHVSTWQTKAVQEIDTEMQVEEEQDILSTWLCALNKPHLEEPVDLESAPKDADVPVPDTEMEEPVETDPVKPDLPRHIQMIKEILEHVIKFLTNSEQTQAILALECLATGVPLLADYENEMLPLVHLIWQPLVEKFRQKDSLVLGRCFTLLHVLGQHAKEFILKRSLSDVIPQLKQFLKEASVHSRQEKSVALTQEYKLQLNLLRHLAAFIRNLEVVGKHLHDLLSIVTLYLSQAQPKDLQQSAVQVFTNLADYNGPFVYVTLLQRAYQKEFSTNVDEIYSKLGYSLEPYAEDAASQD